MIQTDNSLFDRYEIECQEAQHAYAQAIEAAKTKLINSMRVLRANANVGVTRTKKEEG